MKKGFVRKLTALLALVLLTKTITADYNSIGVRAEEVTEATEEVSDLWALGTGVDAADVDNSSSEDANPEITEEKKETVEEEAAPAEDESKDETEPAEETPSEGTADQAEAAPAEETAPEETENKENTAPAEETPVETENKEEAVSDGTENKEVAPAEETAPAEESKEETPEQKNEDDVINVEKNVGDDGVSDGNANDSAEPSEPTDDEVSGGNVETTITVKYEAGEGGSVSNESDDITIGADGIVVTQNYGSNATPNEGYHFVNWTLNGQEVSRAKNFVPLNEQLTDGATFTANFKEGAAIYITDVYENVDGSVVRKNRPTVEIKDGQMVMGNGPSDVCYRGYYYYSYVINGEETLLNNKDKTPELKNQIFEDQTEIEFIYKQVERERVGFFLLGPKYISPSVTPQEGPQPKEEYYPDGGDDRPLTEEGLFNWDWTGTATNIDRLTDIDYESDPKSPNYRSIYKWKAPGIKAYDAMSEHTTKIDYQYDTGVQASIDAYVKNTYGNDFSEAEDVVWYVYKRQEAMSRHIDGYVSSFVTYKSNNSKNETFEDDRARWGSTVIVKDNRPTTENPNVMFTPEEGKVFIGWNTEADGTGDWYRADDLIKKSEGIQNTNDNQIVLDSKPVLYAQWRSRIKVKVSITPDTDGQGPITTVYYNGAEQVANMNVHVTSTVDKSKNTKNQTQESDKDGNTKILEPETIEVNVTDELQLDVTISNLKVTGGHGTDVKKTADGKIDYYPILLDKSDVHVNVSGIEGNLKDWFTFEISVDMDGTPKSTLAEKAAQIEKNASDDDIKEIGRLYVLPRKVELVSASAEKVYDGTPLTAESVTVNSLADPGKDNGGFVGVDGISAYSNFSSQTEVGTTDNKFNYALNADTKADNYEITQKYGTLKVTAPTETNPPEDPKDPEKKKKTTKKTPKPTTPSYDNNNDNGNGGTPNNESPAVLGAMRRLNGTDGEQPAVLGAARSANTEDTTNTARVFVLMGAVFALGILLFISRKKKKED